MKKFVFITLILFFIITPVMVLAEEATFNIDSSYDISGREDLIATLVKTFPRLSFYVDIDWWNAKDITKQNEILRNLEDLHSEFESRIYPDLTAVFGEERRPGVDGDYVITILLHQMRDGIGGYFRPLDGYLKSQVPFSNEREMIYLTTSEAEGDKLKELLSHEMVHLITSNQKDWIRNVSEEIWLNEARAEYAPTLLGYNNIYNRSYLEERVGSFLKTPTDSITEWQGKKEDYGSVSLFIHYLVEHYGIEILADSLKSDSIGIPSLNEALKERGFNEDFADVFTNWTIAVSLNDCSLGPKYCYKSNNLKSIRLNPDINFLPLVGKTSLSVTNVIKNWSTSWQKFIGGKGTLELEFESLTGLNFKVPYLIQDSDGSYSVNFLELDENQKGKISISDFDDKNLIIIPSLQTKIEGFREVEATYPFTYTVSTLNGGFEEDQELIRTLLIQIDYLQKEIAKIQAKIRALSGAPGSVCKIIRNLNIGSSNEDVRCLQTFLRSQTDIYPEGLVTGYFGKKTKKAVIRFQERYAPEVLNPLGLFSGTGYVGKMTLDKINQLLTLHP